jgi:hypothetical protein
MTRREPDDLPLDRLGGEAQSVLAVLTMAALWPTRFPDGWVSVRAFGENGLLLGERAGRESLKAAIRRGVRRISQVSSAPTIECRRTVEHDEISAKPRRDRDRRLVAPPSLDLEEWLLATGAGLVLPATWRLFLPALWPQRRADKPAARDLLRSALRQAEACLDLAALRVPPHSPEGGTLQRIRHEISRSLGEVREEG